MPKYDWSALMAKWNTAMLNSSEREFLPEAAVKAGWLGAPGATDADIAALEKHLGKTLPTSYREFLQFSNGWQKLSAFIDKVWSAQEVEWFSVRNQDWIDAWNPGGVDPLPPIPDSEYLRYGDEQQGALRSEYMQTALEISDTGDSAILLLNPLIVTDDGEWEAWFLANWMAGARRYRSFWDLMEGEYESFLELEADRVKRDTREAIITSTDPAHSTGDKIQIALDMLREQMQVFAQMTTQGDPMSMMYPQGILETLGAVEQELIALQSVPPAEQPARFRALVDDLHARWQAGQQAATRGFNAMEVLQTLLRGPTMDDLKNVTQRLSGASNAEGYRIAWQTLSGVRI
ncbi:MAG: SMI1/KNR4 family protein [Anaerolineae bacterium]|nr:SMI1/KNR4 family protein [Anaerolineae bacterium]